VTEPNAVPNLDLACELLWQAGHPAIAEALQREVEALAEKAHRLERVLFPRAVQAGELEQELAETQAALWKAQGDPYAAAPLPEQSEEEADKPWGRPTF
jgi:hypothetical protein